MNQAVDDHLRFTAAAFGPLTVVLLPGPDFAQHWPQPAGSGVLTCWTGERAPQARLAPVGTNPQAGVVGVRPLVTDDYAAFAGQTFVEGANHFAGVWIDGFGRMAIDAQETQTLTFDALGDPVFRPNAPSRLGVRLLSDNTPLVEWVYSALNSQLAAVAFDVFESDGVTLFNFASPVGAVTLLADVTRYRWKGSAMGIGETRVYTVRARAAGGAYSLIARELGMSPSPDPDSVDLADCPSVERTS